MERDWWWLRARDGMDVAKRVCTSIKAYSISNFNTAVGLPSPIDHCNQPKLATLNTHVNKIVVCMGIQAFQSSATKSVFHNRTATNRQAVGRSARIPQTTTDQMFQALKHHRPNILGRKITTDHILLTF